VKSEEGQEPLTMPEMMNLVQISECRRWLMWPLIYWQRSTYSFLL
jgi:hypothetical protein